MGVTGCGAPAISYAGAAAHSGVLGDGQNSIEWVEYGWTELGLLEDAMATTDLDLVRQPDGRWDIVEADIRINAEHFQWTVGEPAAGSSARNLTAVLTHELLHALGLLHPCETPSVSGVPVCSMAFQDLAMYPFYEGRERLPLQEDDRDGLCAIYPCADGDCPGEPVCPSGDCPPAGTLCLSDLSCGSGHCIDQVCVAQPLFDVCTTADDCGGAACGPAGYCTVACSSSCGGDATCEDGFCVPVAAAFGEFCEFSDDCQSDICLDIGGEARCSRACRVSADCPLNHSCEVVADDNICTPDAHASCSAGAPGRRAAPWPHGLSLSLILLFAIARRASSRSRGSQ